MIRAIACFVVVLIAGACAAQSWTRADQIGVGRIKHWDDIKETSSPSQILDSLTPGDTPASSAAPESGSSSAFYERRELPETSALRDYFLQLLASKDSSVSKAAGLHLQLPDSEKWFSQTFGAQAGVELEREYGSLRAGWIKQFDSLLKGLRGRGETAVAVEVIRSATDPDATPAQRQAIAAMQQPAALYTVRFINPQTHEQYVMSSFAYVDGGFRFVGRLGGIATARAATPTPDPASPLGRLSQ